MKVDEYINVDRMFSDEKLFENVLVYIILNKKLRIQNHCQLGSIK